jgi:methyl acetate hydrolase
MGVEFRGAADAILSRIVTSSSRVPSVVAMVTDHHRNIYEGAAGVRRLDRGDPMTTDTVFAIFSTTKGKAMTLA